jgi:hypothetical protein
MRDFLVFAYLPPSRGTRSSSYFIRYSKRGYCAIEASLPIMFAVPSIRKAAFLTYSIPLLPEKVAIEKEGVLPTVQYGGR